MVDLLFPVVQFLQYHSYRFVMEVRYRAGSVEGEVSPTK